MAKPDIEKVMSRILEDTDVLGVLDTWRRTVENTDKPYVIELSDGYWQFTKEPSEDTIHCKEVIAYLEGIINDSK